MACFHRQSASRPCLVNTQCKWPTAGRRLEPNSMQETIAIRPDPCDVVADLAGITVQAPTTGDLGMEEA